MISGRIPSSSKVLKFVFHIIEVSNTYLGLSRLCLLIACLYIFKIDGARMGFSFFLAWGLLAVDLLSLLFTAYSILKNR